MYYQFIYEVDDIRAPRTQNCQITIILTTITTLIKTFFFLRIIQNVTQLVIMIKNVIADLRNFLFFFMIQLILFSNILGILYVDNYNHPNDKIIKDQIEMTNLEQTEEYDFDAQ